MSLFSQSPFYSRRHTSRVETQNGVWVYWRCNGMADVSHVRDLSAGGLFLATPRPVGMKAKLDFLVQEKQIRAEAVVRHIEAGSGLGLKFTDCDRSRRAASRYLAYKASEPLLFPRQKVTARSAFSATLGRT